MNFKMDGKMSAIKVENLSKVYKLYNKPVDRMKESLHPFRKRYHRDFYALNDVSFEIKKGETVGIIGKNGSGKSTLLKILTGVLTPTSGKVEVNGRVSALLELGAGFNPEFTGLENVYFNGSIMGYTREEMDAKIDDILSFADIGDFINQPVKMYSSGMFVRLAFSVATVVDPEILIVDEALSVGDMFFQAKCMTKMKKMIDDGTTLLFVSHDTGSIKGLCNKGIFLDSGSLVSFGKASDIIDLYIRDLYHAKNESLQKNRSIQTKENMTEAKESESFDIKVSLDRVNLGNHIFEFGSGQVEVLDVKLLDSGKKVTNSVKFKEDFIIQIAAKYNSDISSNCLGYKIKDFRGIELYGTTSIVEHVDIFDIKKNDCVVIQFEVKNILNKGKYSITVFVEEVVYKNAQHAILAGIDNSIVFEIKGPENGSDDFWTMTHLPVNVRYKLINRKESQ